MREKSSNFFKLLSLVLFLFLVNPSLIKAEVEVVASVDRQTIHQNEELNLTVKVSNPKGNIPAPHLPSFSGFDIFYSGRASQFTFVNGKSQSTVAFNYVLVPKSVGVFTLTPIEILVDGEKHKTDPIQIEVLGRSSINSPSQAPPPQAPNQQQLPQNAGQFQAAASSQAADENIFLRANPSKRMLYSNEQLLLTYSLLTRYDTRYEGFEEEPEASGFWIEEFPLERELPKQTEVINGRKYVRADIKKLALFPTAPGEYTIKPGSVKASVQIEQSRSSFLDEFFNDSFFSNSGVFARRVDKTLSTSPIEVVVRPLPAEGKPAGFNGTVGNFKMDTSVDRLEIKQNEPVTLKIVIEGDGNIETLSRPPIPELPDVKVYDANAKSEFFKSENLISGRKTFEVIFIPKLSGNLEIPPIEFSFFSPKSERYVVLKGNSFQIKVNASLSSDPVVPKELYDAQILNKKEIVSTDSDIQYIHEKLNTRSDSLRDWVLAFSVFNLMLTVVAIYLGVRKRRDAFLSSNVAFKRHKFAKRKAKQLYRKITHLADKKSEQDQQLFFDESERLMNQYLADRLNVSPQGITHQMIFDTLNARNISAEIIKKVKNFYDVCGYVRYGAGKFEAKTQEILDAVEAVLKEDI